MVVIDMRDSTLNTKNSKTKLKSTKSKKKELSYKEPVFSADFLEKHVGQIPRDRLDQLKSGEVTHPIKKKKSSELKKYNAKVDDLNKTYAEYDAGNYLVTDQEEETAKAKKVKFAIWLSFITNVVLTFAKLLALILSGSITVLASFLDSVLDLISGSVIFITSCIQKVKKNEEYKWPIGKRRLEPLGVIVFAAVMFTATAQVIVESVDALSDLEKYDIMLEYPAIGVLIATVIIKFILFIICRAIDHPSVRAYAQDHRNDVVGNIVALGATLSAYYWQIWIDPVGGMIIALVIMYSWASTGLEHVKSMLGKSADPQFLSKLTYIAWKHEPNYVLGVDTVRAYSIANLYWVEVDILLPSKMKLKKAHDIGESLQNKYEMLPEVERAFVHIDYEYSHRAADEHVSLI